MLSYERMFLFAMFLCVMTTGMAAEEDEKQENKASSSLLSQIHKTHNENAKPHRLGNNFLLVRSPDGRGSAFLTRLWNQPVIVTNAHVFLEMRDPEVVNINGKVYKIKEILGSKSRDLVILSYEAADVEPEGLQIADDVAAIPLSTKVTVHGNSLGDDVIVTQRGKLLGIGPDKIETDAPFVSGNSGGPVMLSDGDKVIGVATSLRFIRPNRTTVGSKYDSRIEEVVRRFATRIDNLTPTDLEMINLSDLNFERELVRQTDDWVTYMKKIFAGNVSEKSFLDFRNYSIEQAQLFTNNEAVKWHSSYLRKKFETNREMIEAVLKILDLEDAIKLSRIVTILTKNVEKFIVTSKPGAPVRCFICNGSGKLSFKRENPNYDRFSPSSRYIIEYKNCQTCNGSGRRKLWPANFCFTIPLDVSEEIAQYIDVSKEEFCGFQLGGKKADELKRFAFYQKKPLYSIPNPFGETLVYAGNHQDQSAASTILTFMFDRLLSVEILMPRESTGTFQKTIDRFCQNGRPNPASMLITVSPISTYEEVPVDLRGNPLLRATTKATAENNFLGGAGGVSHANRTMSSEDQVQFYEGIMITGSHPCLNALKKGLDLSALAKQCKQQ